MRCERAAAIGLDMSRSLSPFYSPEDCADAAGQLERHYRRACECFAGQPFRKVPHIDWSAFDD